MAGRWHNQHRSGRWTEHPADASTGLEDASRAEAGGHEPQGDASDGLGDAPSAVREPVKGSADHSHAETTQAAQCPVITCIRRGVAQLGSAPLWGSGGRGFKSRRSDKIEYVTNQSPLLKIGLISLY